MRIFDVTKDCIELNWIHEMLDVVGIHLSAHLPKEPGSYQCGRLPSDNTGCEP
jgi:hypothetical protein